MDITISGVTVHQLRDCRFHLARTPRPPSRRLYYFLDGAQSPSKPLSIQRPRTHSEEGSQVNAEAIHDCLSYAEGGICSPRLSSYKTGRFTGQRLWDGPCADRSTRILVVLEVSSTWPPAQYLCRLRYKDSGCLGSLQNRFCVDSDTDAVSGLHYSLQSNGTTQVRSQRGAERILIMGSLPPTVPSVAHRRDTQTSSYVRSRLLVDCTSEVPQGRAERTLRVFVQTHRVHFEHLPALG